MSRIEPLNQAKSVNIDFPFMHYDDYRLDGNLATSFHTTKIMIDRAVSLGFDTVSFDTNVPIDSRTGELQLFVTDYPYNPDKNFPEAVWESIRYAESLGLKTVIDLNIRNASDDMHITVNDVGSGFDTQTFFDTVRQYETEIAQRANSYGVDGIRIGRFNYGFDTVKYINEWTEIVNSIRSVYPGTLSYFGHLGDTQNIVWDLVDEVQFDFPPTFLLESDYTKEDIAQLYFGSYKMRDGTMSSETAYAAVKNLIDRYPDKKISVGVSFLPGQSAGYEDAFPWEHAVATDAGILTPYPEELIDVKLNQQKIAGFLEFFGNYLANDISGINFWQYAPWTEAAWVRDPGNLLGEVWQSVVRAGGSLNWFPESEETIAEYFLRDWGFKTLHYGSADNDVLTGSEVDDKFFLTAGDDQLVGGLGHDVLSVSRSIRDFAITNAGESWLLEGPTTTDFTGTKRLNSIERIEFTDGNVALDTDGVAGQAYRIYKAAFDRVPDSAGLGFWIAAMDAGTELDQVAKEFVASREFKTLYGETVNNRDFVTLLYNNVLDRDPEPSGFEFWDTALNNGASRSSILIGFSESFENQLNVADLISTGIEYTPYIN